MAMNQAVISKRTDLTPIQPQTEEQLFARIDHSIAQINPDNCEDLEDVAVEMMSEIDDYENKLK